MWKLTHLKLRLPLAVLCFLAAAPAHALTFSFTYAPSVAADFGANTTAMTNALTYVADQYESAFSDNVTLNIAITATATTTYLGATTPAYALPAYSYSTVRNALLANVSTTTNSEAYSTLPGFDPLAASYYTVPTAEAKALGLIPSGGTASDATISFSDSYYYTFDPNHRAVSGATDFIGVAEHELAHAMGRASGDNYNQSGPSYFYTPIDLFRFSAPDVRPTYAGATSTNYFSVDNGTTNYRTFATSSDVSDWNQSVIDSYDAFIPAGAEYDISAADYAEMNVLGYHPTATTHIWAVDADSNWSGAGNWVDYGVPSGIGIQVQFNQQTSAFRFITLDVAATAGTLTFNDNPSYGYTLNGSQTLTMQTNTGNAAIQVLGGFSHQISANLSLASNTNITVASHTSLAVSGNIAGAGSLTMLGPGALALSGNDNLPSGLTVDGSGTTILLGGYLNVGNGEIIGNSGAGNFTQSGGTNNAFSINIGALSGSSGTYNIQGAAVLAVGPGSLVVGSSGTGIFVQSAATVSASGGLVLGYYPSGRGTYTLGGPGEFTTTYAEFIGSQGPGTFIQSGGTNNCIGNLDVGGVSGGTYNMNGAGLFKVSGNVAPIEYIPYAGTGLFTQSAGTNNCSGNAFDIGLYIGYGLNSSGTYSLNGTGVLSTTGTLVVGFMGMGDFTQSGGANNVAPGPLYLAYDAGSKGTYNLSGNGLLSAGTEAVGLSGSGSFSQSGGSNMVSNQLFLGYAAGSSGAYNLNGGTLSCSGDQHVGDAGTGNFTQSGGVFNAGNLYLAYRPGSNGSYNLSGTGTLNIPTAAVLNVGYSGSATFVQSGGAVNMGPNALLNVGFNPGSSGAYFLNAGVLEDQGSENIGEFAAGSFSQPGGINDTFELYVGNSANGGAYTLSGQGVLTTTGSEFIGAFGPGSFTQSGGTHNAGSIYLGYGNSTTSGTYALSGGAINSSSQYVGNFGQGYFTQSGAVNNAGLLTLGRYNGSSGTYALGGGTLACSQITGGQGASTFYFNGGVLIPSTSSGNFMSGLTAAYVEYNGALINTNGFNITIAQPLLNGSGGGSLEKSGAGALTLAAANTFTNGVILYAGTLVAANTSGSALGSGPLLPDGGILAAGPAGGTISGPVLAGGAPYTIAPGAVLASGYGTLNLDGGLASTSYTKLLFNISASTSLGTGSNGVNIYGGDLLNFNGGTLSVVGGQIALTNTPTQTGDYRLIDDATLTGGAASLGNFVLPNQSGISYVLSTAVDSGYIDLIVGVGNAGTSGGTWTHNGNGSWATGSDWSGGLFPSSGTVTLGSPGGPIMVTLDGYRTAGALVFNGVGGYTLAQGASGALTLGTTAGGSIAVNNGSHTISAAVQMAGNLTVGVASGASLQLSGALSESATGTSFTFNGPGTLNYSATGTFTGNTNVNGGTLNLTGGYLPAAQEYVGGSAGVVIQTGGTNAVSNQMTLGYNGAGTYNLNAGLLAAATEVIGNSFQASSFTQNGGNNTVSSVLYVGFNGSGNYTLEPGAQLSAPSEILGEENYGGYITQYGGANTVSSLTLGYDAAGAYYQYGGQLNATTETFGVTGYGSGQFVQNGGTNTVSYALIVGDGASYYESIYTLTGSGQLSAFAEYVGYNSNGSGFTQSGGTNTVTNSLFLGYNAGSNGSYSLSNGLLYLGENNVDEYIGYSGTGSFTQTGGTHVAGLVILGYNAGGCGSYSLQAGSLSAGHEFIGYSGSGCFAQSGGTNATTILFLGLSGGTGTYCLSGSGQLSALYEYIGWPVVTGSYSGTGSFTQTGGTNSAGNLNLAYSSGYSGTYCLNGGLLSLTALNQGSGSATFNFGGGTLQAAAPLTTYMPITLSTPGSNGVFDTNGNASTLFSPVSGPGGLIVAGSGTLTLAVSNNYTGTTLVSNGTLLLANSNALSGSTFDTTGSGLLSFQGGVGGFAFGGLQGSGSLLLTDASVMDVALTVGGNNASTTFFGSLSDSNTGGSLTKVGTGTLVLSGTNSYGGGTVVLDGMLIVTNNEGLADGSSLTVGDPTMFPAAVVPLPTESKTATNATVPVPEPGTLGLLVTCAALLAMYRKRRSRSKGDRTGVD